MSSVSGFNSSTEGEVSSAYDAFFESSYHQELNLQLFVLLSLTINLSIYVLYHGFTLATLCFCFCVCIKQDLICIAIEKNILGHERCRQRVLLCPRFVVAIKLFGWSVL